MNTLILGASGLVGGNCLEYFSKQGWSCLGTHFSFETPHTSFFNTLNINDPKNADLVAFAPKVIIHCGALTHVDYCEDHLEESRQKTVDSTRNAIMLAQQFDAKLVYLGTDYVFDGAMGYYEEDAETNPLSVYGRHKLEAEHLIQKSGLDHLICRITNVYGSELRGKNFVVRLVENMHKHEPMELKLPMDQYATPVNAYDVARAISLLVKDDKSGVYHFASTDYFNRVQLAERVMKYFGHSGISLIPVTTEQLQQPAARPLAGGFNPGKFNGEYPGFSWSNVDDFLKELFSKYNE